MRNRNEEDNGDGQTKFGAVGMPRIGPTDADAAQAEQVRQMLSDQAEMQRIQLNAMQAQIVHMLVASIRVLTRIEDVPDDEKVTLITKMILAIHQQLGVLPGEKSADTPKRGMGFGSA